MKLYQTSQSDRLELARWRKGFPDLCAICIKLAVMCGRAT